MKKIPIFQVFAQNEFRQSKYVLTKFRKYPITKFFKFNKILNARKSLIFMCKNYTLKIIKKAPLEIYFFLSVKIVLYKATECIQNSSVDNDLKNEYLISK